MDAQLTAALIASELLTCGALRLWQAPSAERTLKPGADVQPALRLNSQPAALQWPNKAPSDFLDYSLDISAFLLDSADSIAAVGGVVSGALDTALLLSSLTFVGGVLTAWLGGGTAGVTYSITLDIQMVSARHLRRVVWITVGNWPIYNRTSGDPKAIAVGPPGVPGLTGQPGLRGDQGLPGPVYIPSTYTYIQAVPAATWTITHNLNRRPSIDVVDSTGQVGLGDRQYISVNQIILSFSAEFSGEAYLN